MREDENTTRHWRRRLAGWIWLSFWVVLLWLIASPWRHLGGLVSESLRWLESFCLPAALTVGCYVGTLGRDAAKAGRGRSHAGLLRRLLLPAAALTAMILILMKLMWWDDQIGIAFTAFMAYWAGLDIAFGAYPLMEGRHYSFRGPILPDIGSGDRRSLSPWLGG
jgi:hypothetical protein